MKKLAAIIVVTAAVAGSAPVINGMLMEKSIRGAFADLNSLYAETGMDYSIEILRYDRNLFTSDIEWRIDFGSLKPFYTIEEVVFSDHAQHGFLGVSSTTSLDKNSWFNSFIDNKLQGRNPFSLHTSYSFTGTIKSTFKFEPFTFTVEGESLQIDQGEFVIQTDEELKTFNTSAIWQGFTGGDQVKMGKAAIQSEMEMISTFLWDGYITLDLEEMTIAHQQQRLEMNNVSASYVSQVDTSANMVHSQVELNLGKLATGSSTSEGAQATMAINNMNTKGYEEFMRAYSRMAAETLENIAALDDNPQQTKKMIEEQMAEIGLRLIAAFEKLLNKDLELVLSDVLIKTAEGDITGDISLQLLKNMTLMQFAPIFGQPDLALKIFSLHSKITLPAALTGEPSMLLEAIYPGMQTGLFVKEGNTLRHEAETRADKLYLNGRVLDLTKAQ